jgi:Flp pilus assembly protein TadD
MWPSLGDGLISRLLYFQSRRVAINAYIIWNIMAFKAGIGLVCICLLAGSTLSFSQTAPDTQQQIAIHAQKAQEFLRDKKPDLAMPELEALLALDPDNSQANGNLGVLLFFRHDYANAIPHLRKTVAAQPSLTRIQALLGMAERDTGDLVAARTDLEMAFPLIQDPKLHTQVGMQLVEIYTAGGDLDKCAAMLAQLRRSDPEDPEILYAAYRTYSDLANESMLTLSLVAPDSAQMHQIAAHEQTRQGNTAGAIEEYRKAIVINPRLPGVHFELAELLNRADEAELKQQALPEYQEALKQNPLDADTQCRLGDLFALRGDPSKAFVYLSKAVELQPDNAEANFGLAQTLIVMNQEAKALPILEHAVQLEPTDATAHYLLGTLYREAGRTEDAKRELAQFQKYKHLKEKLRAIYKEMQIQPAKLEADEPSAKQ